MDIIKIKKEFADTVYQKYIEDMYGIKICCDRDFDLVDVKNSIIDLDAIYDENKCKATIVNNDCCLQPCDATSMLYVPQISQCPSPKIISIQFLIG